MLINWQEIHKYSPNDNRNDKSLSLAGSHMCPLASVILCIRVQINFIISQKLTYSATPTLNVEEEESAMI